MGKRRLICSKPSTRSTGSNTYCDDHGDGPPSHQVARARRQERQASAQERQRQRDSDMVRYAKRHIAKVSAELAAAPPPQLVEDRGGVGGVHIW